ncbi:TIGR03862 family flavoprotein [Arenimonas oryziterrae]|uniref:NAD(FAD)-utilizing dehydrogenase n=1 Tax=Arenimonas oryziterrae DSM 21050 = YC6267 TaxID=1121015 RepID=A0A091AUE0_9GAMM|nr:TIGR03862 family flavoprotein [Arenimonas oryziterrae]KFN42847.1 hypothetical protein N789_12000 [Arenimonas oryziterrae DSM 21050 = YC6267]
MSLAPSLRLAIVGGGPAGLMAAESARAAGIDVDVFEGKGSVGRKFLIAGKGGLNLTHSEARSPFVDRYGDRREDVARWLSVFDADALRDWARGLGVDTFVGSSGRVFPTDMKAAPLLRAWVRRLRESGVRFHVHHRCTGWDADGALCFDTPSGPQIIRAQAVVLALGGGSWPQLGSDGAWLPWLAQRGADIAPLQAANCGFEIAWSEIFAQRFAGHPLKPVKILCPEIPGDGRWLQGECVISETGIEGSLIYARSARLREQINAEGSAVIHLDLAPGRDLDRLTNDLARPRGGRSMTDHLRRVAGIEGVKTGLLYETMSKAAFSDPATLAATIKSLPLTLQRPRPIAETISSAGGVRFSALDPALMLRHVPGVFCAGEMIDWEAPTGGYLLTACFASGKIAGAGAADYLSARSATHDRA